MQMQLASHTCKKWYGDPASFVSECLVIIRRWYSSRCSRPSRSHVVACPWWHCELL